MTISWLFRLGLAFMGITLFLGCSSSKVKYGLVDGTYKVRHHDGRVEESEVYLDETDSIRIIKDTKHVEPIVGKSMFLKKDGFDADFMIVPFKFRASAAGLPHQLTTQFNGNLFLGYRLDRYQVTYTQTPVTIRRDIKHRALSVGVFGGIGSATVAPWTTRYQIIDEYNGFILARGLAAMVGVNDHTVGIGIGWDYLTDRDKSIWIYQNKPWIGLTYSLNLN
jgi:hypothetical protein